LARVSLRAGRKSAFSDCFRPGNLASNGFVFGVFMFDCSRCLPCKTLMSANLRDIQKFPKWVRFAKSCFAWPPLFPVVQRSVASLLTIPLLDGTASQIIHREFCGRKSDFGAPLWEKVRMRASLSQNPICSPSPMVLQGRRIQIAGTYLKPTSEFAMGWQGRPAGPSADAAARHPYLEI